MISRVFSLEIETREPGTFRYLILYRKSVEGGGEQEPVLITDISPTRTLCPVPLSPTWATLCSRHPFHELILPLSYPPYRSPYPCLLLSPFPLNTYTRLCLYARTPSCHSISDLRTETSPGFSPGTLPCLYAVAVSAEGIGTWGLMFRN